jgi:hypothetical protein
MEADFASNSLNFNIELGDGKPTDMKQANSSDFEN